MYKKAFSVQNQNLLSKKDLKTLRAQLLEHFPALDEKALDQLLPEGQVKVLKLDTRCLLYAVGDGPPLFFDAEGRGELYPCLTTLWKHPNMMQDLTIHAPVSKFVLNGADLMLPGVIVPPNGVAGLGSFTKGQRRCIKIEGNPYPIAVGKMLVNQAQFEKLKGKGMEVLHVYKDALWAYSGKLVPNAGFTEKEDEVAPCADASFVLGETSSAEAVVSTASGGTDAGAAATPDGGPVSPKPSSSAEVKAEASTPKAGAAQAGRGADDWTQDELLEFCFMQAFQVSLSKDDGLPIDASEFFEKHMKPTRPPGTTLDVKKSSHKQIGKFLNVMRKAKVIDVTEKKNVVHVTKVDRNHKLFGSLKEKFASDVAAVATSTATPTAGDAKTAPAGLPAPQVFTVWKPTHYTEPLFKAAGKSKSECYTWEASRAVLVAYCEKEGLIDGDRVKVSEDLLTILYKHAGGAQKTEFPTQASMEDLEDKLQERMQEHTTIDVAGVGATTRKGPPVKIEVALSKKGAHNVSRITNLEAFGLDVDKIGDELKKKFNCTVNVEALPGKNAKDKVLQLQGHLQQEFKEYLLARYGISPSFLLLK